jgi:hypothetical protein
MGTQKEAREAVTSPRSPKKEEAASPWAHTVSLSSSSSPPRAPAPPTANLPATHPRRESDEGEDSMAKEGAGRGRRVPTKMRADLSTSRREPLTPVGGYGPTRPAPAAWCTTPAGESMILLVPCTTPYLALSTRGYNFPGRIPLRSLTLNPDKWALLLLKLYNPGHNSSEGRTVMWMRNKDVCEVVHLN